MFHRINITQGRLAIADVAVADLVAGFSTPLYVIDGNVLAEQAAALVEQLRSPQIRLLYSIKANPSLQVIRTLVAVGFDLDACSLGDVLLARTAVGGDVRVSYTGVGLNVEEIQQLVATDVWLNLDSLHELALFSAAHPGRDAGLRVIVDIEAGFHPHCQAAVWGGKFGVPLDELPEAFAMMRAAGGAIRTLHSHLGSSLLDAGPYLAALDTLLRVAADYPEVRTLNLGGGFGPPYHPDDPVIDLAYLREQIVARLDDFENRHGRAINVEIEPGEFLVSEAGYLLTTVRVTKRFQVGEAVHHCAIVDGGMNLTPAHSLYGTYLHLYVEGKEGVEAASESFDVYGITNQAGDRLAVRRSLPPLTEGDVLVVRNAGAYAYARSTWFNERVRPAEVWVQDGAAKVMREAERAELLMAGQHVW